MVTKSKFKAKQSFGEEAKRSANQFSDEEMTSSDGFSSTNSESSNFQTSR
jgi:hypothetical protein